MSMTQEPSVRPLRYCDVCGELDDHPRHIVQVPIGTPGAVPTTEFLDGLPTGGPITALAQLLDPATVIRHMNCCANAGCQVCAITEEATAGARGPELIDVIAGGALEGVDVDDIPLNVEAI